MGYQVTQIIFFTYFKQKINDAFNRKLNTYRKKQYWLCHNPFQDRYFCNFLPLNANKNVKKMRIQIFIF